MITISRRGAAILAILSIAGCGALDRLTRDREESFDVSRIEGVPEEEERPEPVLDWETRRDALKKRFPGADRVELVRLLVWPEPRTGTCLSRVVPLRERPLTASYALRGFLGQRSELGAGSLGELVDQGWTGTYRTPVGTGFERRAEFAAFDVTLDAAIECRCTGARGQEIGDPAEATIRFRWTGPGAMPEVSGTTRRNGKPTGMPVSFSPGNLFTYELDLRGRYPAGRPGRCGGTVRLTLLVAPPMR